MFEPDILPEIKPRQEEGGGKKISERNAKVCSSFIDESCRTCAISAVWKMVMMSSSAEAGDKGKVNGRLDKIRSDQIR